MAERPIFSSTESGEVLVRTKTIEFQWYPGFSIPQKQKSVKALHEAALSEGFNKVLEVSTKSRSQLGFKLSAFNLRLTTELGKNLFLESVYQASKVFSNGGPFIDIALMAPKEAKRDSRLKSSGDLSGFEFEGEKFPLQPETAFYDWLYLYSLRKHASFLEDRLSNYDGFSDIEFNPEKSISSQSRSCALLLSFIKRGVYPKIVFDTKLFFDYLKYDERNKSNFGQLKVF